MNPVPTTNSTNSTSVPTATSNTGPDMFSKITGALTQGVKKLNPFSTNPTTGGRRKSRRASRKQRKQRKQRKSRRAASRKARRASRKQRKSRRSSRK